MAGTATELLRTLATVPTCITISQLADQLQWSRKRLRKAINVLRRYKMITSVRKGCYRATPAGHEAHKAALAIRPGPRKGSKRAQRHDPNALRSRLWRAMRLKRRFTVGDLISCACTEDEQARPKKAIASAQRYLSLLRRQGYVIVQQQREPGTRPTSPGFKRYLLLPDRDTGHLAPQIRKDGSLFDPNVAGGAQP
jgi:hypothetical protein